MTLGAFIKKWCGRALYEDHSTTGLAGRIQVWRGVEGKIIFMIPTWHGWKDDAQKRRFYADAKKAGIKNTDYLEWSKDIRIPMENNKCPYCTDGQNEVLVNYADFHYHGEAPITEMQPCEECGGTGEIPNEDETER